MRKTLAGALVATLMMTTATTSTATSKASTAIGTATSAGNAPAPSRTVNHWTSAAAMTAAAQTTEQRPRDARVDS